MQPTSLSLDTFLDLLELTTILCRHLRVTVKVHSVFVPVFKRCTSVSKIRAGREGLESRTSSYVEAVVLHGGWQS